MTFVDKGYPDLAARWQAAVVEALRPEVASGSISDLAVTVDHANGHLLYSLSFVDVRERARRTITNLRVTP
jgi:hypothetical protein